jgi:hypothetical protein
MVEKLDLVVVAKCWQMHQKATRQGPVCLGFCGECDFWVFLRTFVGAAAHLGACVRRIGGGLVVGQWVFTYAIQNMKVGGGIV